MSRWFIFVLFDAVIVILQPQLSLFPSFNAKDTCTFMTTWLLQVVTILNAYFIDLYSYLKHKLRYKAERKKASLMIHYMPVLCRRCINLIKSQRVKLARLLKIHVFVVKTEGYLPKFFVWVCGPNLEICTLFQARNCDFLYPFQT